MEKSVGKPGSVVDNHSSRPAIADRLQPPTRRLSEPLHRLPIWCCSGWRLPRFTVTQYARLCGPIPRLGPYVLQHKGCCVWPLASILLYGARTFLPHLRGGGCLTGFSECDYKGIALPVVDNRIFCLTEEDQRASSSKAFTYPRCAPDQGLSLNLSIHLLNTS